LEEKRAKKELTAERVAVLASRYAARLHRQRATLIARTETLRAANLGQQLSWQRAAEAGALVPAEWRRFWILTRDDRTCPHCRKMLAHPGVMLTQSFETDFGLVLTPPQHPGCRCTVALRPAEPAESSHTESGQAPLSYSEMVLWLASVVRHTGTPIVGDEAERIWTFRAGKFTSEG
jgi:hypothetical protein